MLRDHIVYLLVDAPVLLAQKSGRRLFAWIQTSRFWLQLITGLVGIMVVCGIVCTVGWPPSLHNRGGGMAGLLKVSGDFLWMAGLAAYAMAIFKRGNDYDWYYVLQYLAYLLPVLILTWLIGSALGYFVIFYFSGFIFVSGWLFLKWLYQTVPDDD